MGDLYGNMVQSKVFYNDSRYIEYLAKMHGKDSLNYLSFEKCKKVFISEKIEGFIAYVVVKKVALCIGDPICISNEKRGFILNLWNIVKKIKLNFVFLQ